MKTMQRYKICFIYVDYVLDLLCYILVIFIVIYIVQSIQSNSVKFIFCKIKMRNIRNNELLFVTLSPDLYGVETWKE